LKKNITEKGLAEWPELEALCRNPRTGKKQKQTNKKPEPY
jgi:hypothetical protein